MHANTRTSFRLLMASMFLVAAGGEVARADTLWGCGARGYRVKITNITRGQHFTPILVASHRAGVELFSVGEPASEELAALAEGGATDPLAAALRADPDVAGMAVSEGLLGPGESVVVTVRTRRGANRISLAGMLLPTNDGFVSLNSVLAPCYGARTYNAVAYDAGSEPNDEDCAHIPGPLCDGEGPSPDEDGEGYVHVHAGIHGIGDLVAADYDWRNPIARVKIVPIR